MAAMTAMRTIRLLGALTVAMVVAWPAVAAARTAPAMKILRPEVGTVWIGGTGDVDVSTSGIENNVSVRFLVDVDGSGVNPQTGRPDEAGQSGAFTMVAGATNRITLNSLTTGVHTITVRATDPQGVSPASVVVNVRPGGGGGFNYAAVMVGLFFLALFLVYRRFILKPRFGRMEDEARRGGRPGFEPRGNGSSRSEDDPKWWEELPPDDR